MRFIYAIFIGFLIINVSPIWGETYKWEDDEGVTHFSDDVSSIPKNKKNKVKKMDDSISHTNTPAQTINKKSEHSPAIKPDEIKAEKYKRGSAEFVTLEGQLSNTWNNMRQALKVRNIEGALTYFTESTRDSFRSQFTAMKKDLPEIAKEMGEARLVKVEEDSFAECDIRRVENGETYSFMLQFVRDYDGMWRIRTF